MSEHRSPRVNKALMPKYIGQTVRLIVKLITFREDYAIVETPDKGEVEVKLLRDFNPGSTYFEVIAIAVDERTIKMVGFISMGDDVDMALVDTMVQIWHDPRFSKVF